MATKSLVPILTWAPQAKRLIQELARLQNKINNEEPGEAFAKNGKNPLCSTVGQHCLGCFVEACIVNQK